MSDFDLVAGSFVSQAEMETYASHEFRFEGAGSTTVPLTDEQKELVTKALNMAFADVVGHYLKEGYDFAGMSQAIDIAEWQQVVAMCHLAPEEFLLEDPTDSAWPPSFCERWEAHKAANLPLLKDNGVEIPKMPDSDAAQRRQIKSTNRNGLLDEDHDRIVDYDPSTRTRHDHRRLQGTTSPNRWRR